MVKKTIPIMILALLMVGSALAICGDAVCEDTENPDICPHDCPNDVNQYVECLLDEQQCTFPTMYYHAKNFVMFIFFMGAIVFLKWRDFI